jgi:hypothetical protein
LAPERKGCQILALEDFQESGPHGQHEKEKLPTAAVIFRRGGRRGRDFASAMMGGRSRHPDEGMKVGKGKPSLCCGVAQPSPAQPPWWATASHQIIRIIRREKGKCFGRSSVAQHGAADRQRVVAKSSRPRAWSRGQSQWEGDSDGHEGAAEENKHCVPASPPVVIAATSVRRCSRTRAFETCTSRSPSRGNETGAKIIDMVRQGKGKARSQEAEYRPPTGREMMEREIGDLAGRIASPSFFLLLILLPPPLSVGTVPAFARLRRGIAPAPGRDEAKRG